MTRVYRSAINRLLYMREHVRNMSIEEIGQAKEKRTDIKPV